MRRGTSTATPASVNTPLLGDFPDGFVCGLDAQEFLDSLPEASASIVFVDPPFNLGKRYGVSPPGDDRLDEQAYRSYMTSVLASAANVLRPGGALFLYHVPRWAMEFGCTVGGLLQFRHWIAISMKNGYAGRARLYPAHYALLYFTKGEPAHAQRPKIPLRMCRHCGKPIRDYGGYAKHVEAGVTLSDFWDDVSPLRHRSHKYRVANELPPVILDRVLAIAGEPGGLLVDPFAGSGSAAVAARRFGMRFAVNDRDPHSCEVILDRLQAAAEG